MPIYDDDKGIDLISKRTGLSEPLTRLLWMDFSEDVWCAGFIEVTDERIVEFIGWINEKGLFPSCPCVCRIIYEEGK